MIIMMLVFYGLCAVALFCNGGKKIIKQIHLQFTWRQRFIFIGALLLFVMFIVYWPNQNKFAYYWDYAGYWSMSVRQMNNMRAQSFFDTIVALQRSISYDDYNTFISAVIAFPLSVFGCSFSKYVIIYCVMFLLPAYLVQGLTIAKLIDFGKNGKSKVFLIAFIAAICFPGNYYAAFRGYVDVAFLLPLSLAMYLFVDYDFRKVSIAKNASIALMLVLAWICRRYVVFFIIGYVCAMLVKAVIVIIEDKGFVSFGSIALNFIEIGAISLGILLVFFREFFLHALLTNYGAMYSAYNAPLTSKIYTLVDSLGYALLLIVVLAGVGCFIYKKQRANYLSLIAMAVVETAVFWRVQIMGEHHRMILNLPVFILCMLILVQWNVQNENKPSKASRKKAIVILCLLTMLVNFAISFGPGMDLHNNDLPFSERYMPLVRDDMDRLNNLTSELNKLTKDTEDTIYLTASGTILNSDMLRKIYMPYSDNAIPQLLDSNDVDLRDGFPTDFLHAKYIVTTNPAQTHLATGQEVVTYLNSNVMNSSSYIGRHYLLAYQIELDDGVEAKIYRKVSEYSTDDLTRLKDYYMNLYPEYEELFAERIK